MITVRLLRHATLVVNLDGTSFLVDPFLSPKDTFDPIVWTSNGIRNPMTNLPVGEQELTEIIDSSDYVIVTHLHNDHWDEAARRLLPRDKILITQPEDEGTISRQGFVNVLAVRQRYVLDGITIYRTGGMHGTGEIAEKMAPVSGFVLDNGSQVVYIAGDTIWCPDVEDAISKYKPSVIILNAGAAQFDMGDPITMTAEDVLKVCRHSTADAIICVHMETVNHCYLTRAALNNAIHEAGEAHRCLVPTDGELIKI